MQLKLKQNKINHNYSFPLFPGILFYLLIFSYPFGEESMINIVNSEYKSYGEENSLETFRVHSENCIRYGHTVSTGGEL